MLNIVTYTIHPDRDTTNLINELQKSSNWWHYLDTTWLIASNETPEQLWIRLAPNVAPTDYILIAQFALYATYYGWLPKEAFDWIAQHRSD